jgi:hypothetical protein
MRKTTRRRGQGPESEEKPRSSEQVRHGRHRQRKQRRCHAPDYKRLFLSFFLQKQQASKERPNKHLDLLFPVLVALVARDSAYARAASIVYGVVWILTTIVDRKGLVGGFSTTPGSHGSIVRGPPVILSLVSSARRGSHFFFAKRVLW